MTQQNASPKFSLPSAQMGATGYSPKEVAHILTGQGHPITGKQIRRALRKGTIKGIQFSGRWYLPRKGLQALLKSKAKAQEVKSTETKS